LAGGPGLPGSRFFGAPRISIRIFWAQNRGWRFWRKMLMICPDFHSKPDELKRGQIRPLPRRGSTDFGGACLAGGLELAGPRFFGAPRISIRTFWAQNRGWRFWRKMLMICPDFHPKPDELKRGQIRPVPRRGSTDFGGACLAGGLELAGPRFFGAPRISIRTFWAQNRDWRFWRKILMICPDFHAKPDEVKRGQIRPLPRRGSTDFGGACLAGGPELPGSRFFGAPRISIRTFWFPK
jgi:hypothetical protein